MNTFEYKALYKFTLKSFLQYWIHLFICCITRIWSIKCMRFQFNGIIILHHFIPRNMYHVIPIPHNDAGCCIPVQLHHSATGGPVTIPANGIQCVHTLILYSRDTGTKQLRPQSFHPNFYTADHLYIGYVSNLE